MYLKKIFIFFFLSTIATNAYSSEIVNAIDFAKLSFELGHKWDYQKLKEISCEETIDQIEQAEKSAKNAIKLFEKKGINFGKDVTHDFSELNFKTLKEYKNAVIIKVEGRYIMNVGQGVENTTEDLDSKIILKKIGSNYCFFGMKN